MKRMIRPLLFLMVFLTAGLGIAGQDRERRSGGASAAREVRATIALWATAVKNREVRSLDRIFGTDLFVTDQSGKTFGKKEEIDSIRSSATTKTISVTNDDLAVRVFPASRTAVATGLVRMAFRSSGRDSTVAMRFTSVWEKRAGRWQLIVLQVTRLGSR